MGLFSRYFHIILSEVEEPFAQNHSDGKITFRGEGTQAEDETLIYTEAVKICQTLNIPVQVLGHPPGAGEIKVLTSKSYSHPIHLPSRGGTGKPVPKGVS